MKIEFIGAARSVTGSCFIITTDDHTIMVDCGMFQGKRDLRERNNLRLIHTPRQIDAVLVTHAHIDHSGLVPKLVKNGYKGKIFTTVATADLCTIMFPDSAHIQEMDARWVNKKNKKLDRPPVEPLYTTEDADKALEFLNPVQYGQEFEVLPGIRARFRDAGHILGSSFIEMWVKENDKETKIVFSGDLGPNDQAIIRNPEIVEDADILLIESTYGNRLHKNKEDTYQEFKKIILDTYNTRGNIIIPAFAIERTQEIIYTLSKLFGKEELPPIPVYIDSPLAISATEIFRRNEQCFDEATRKMLLEGENSPLDFKNLYFTRSARESKKLNKEAEGAIIISASGMCTAGRIKFHLQNNLYRPESSVIFVGYQAEGTLGRRIIDGAKQVRVYGEDVAVKSKIYTLGGFSAHADKRGLLEWIGNIKNPKLKVFVVHGEEEASLALAESIHETHGFSAYVPRWGEKIDLNTMRSEFAVYGMEDSFTAVDHEIDSLERMFNSLISQYHRAKENDKIIDVKNLEQDLNDLKEMISMVVDEF